MNMLIQELGMFYNWQQISWLVELLLAFYEGLRSTELVYAWL